MFQPGLGSKPRLRLDLEELRLTRIRELHRYTPGYQ